MSTAISKVKARTYKHVLFQDVNGTFGRPIVCRKWSMRIGCTQPIAEYTVRISSRKPRNVDTYVTVLEMAQNEYGEWLAVLDGERLTTVAWPTSFAIEVLLTRKRWPIYVWAEEK